MLVVRETLCLSASDAQGLCEEGVSLSVTFQCL